MREQDSVRSSAKVRFELGSPSREGVVLAGIACANGDEGSRGKEIYGSWVRTRAENIFVRYSRHQDRDHTYYRLIGNSNGKMYSGHLSGKALH